MRKNLSKFRFALLGIIMCLISVCAIGQTARTYSYTFTAQKFDALGTQNLGGWNWTATGTAPNGAAFGWDGQNNKGHQFGTAAKPFSALTLSTSSVRGTVTSVKVNTSGASSVAATFEVKVGETNLLSGEASTITLTKNSTEYEFTGSAEAGTIELIWNQTSSKALYLKSIEVTYTPDPRFVDAPTFTPEAGSYYEPARVALATVAEGAIIYYTIDGTEPTTSSLLYQEPIAVEQTTTIKAIAVREDDSSEVATAVYSFPTAVNSISDFKARGINNSIYKLTTTAKVIYNNPTKKYLFIQDETGALVMYNYTGATYNAGDEITGPIYGTYSLYNGMNEMVYKADAPALPEATAGTPVDAIVATIAQLKNNYAYYEGRLVTVKNVTFIGDKRIVQGEDTMAFHTQLAPELPEFVAGIPGNITGLMVYNSTKTYPYQIFPRSINDIELPATLPYFVDFDQFVDSRLAINNGENVNKWYIGQAQDFDNNKLYISSTNGLTNKYDNTATSTVTVTRDIVIPAVGAVVSFDYHVNGESESDYMQVAIGDLQVRLPQTEGWENYTLNIPGTMAGVQTLTITWRNDGSVGEQFPAAIDNISITEVACAQVSNLNAAVDTTSATITWTALEDQTAWTLEYKLANHSEWYSVNVTTPSVVLNNLQGNSNYDMRVKANCGEASSVWTEGTFAVDCQQQDITVVRADKQIGTATTSNSNLPFYGLYEYSYSQQIFDAAEINASNGLIYSISFYCMKAPDAGTTGGIRIWLGNTTKSSFTSNTDYVDPSELTQVYYNSGDYNYTAGQWHTFVFDQPFAYDGTKNLVVAYYEGKSGYNSSGFQAHSMSNKSIYHYNDQASKVSYTSPASATSTHVRPAYRSNVKLNMDMPTIACVDTISCLDLVSVEANELTPNTATIDWTLAEGSTQNNFVVEYKLENSSDWTVVPVQDATSYELTGLAQKTKYDVRVKAICGENDYSNYATTSFTTPGVCPAVTNITSTNNANATTLTWQAGGEEGAWTVEFRPVGTENWVSLHVSIVPMTTLGGLAGSTPYEVRIKALCDAQDEANQSLWTNYSFTSGCAAVDVPYTQVFGSYTEPDCWNNQDFEFDYNSYAATNDINAWLMSPAINIPANGASYVSFKVNPTGNYKLMASYRGTALARFAEIYAGTSADGEVIVEIPEIYRGRMVNLMLQNGVDNWFYVYNMKVTTCPFVASQLAVSGLTSSSAVLSWQGDERVSSWNVEYKTNDGEWTSMEVSTNPYTLTGLEASTTYQVRVKAACNETYSNTVSFTTPCPARELPFFEGFEDTEFEPECWMNYHVSGPGSYLWQRNTSTSNIHTGSGSAKIPDMSATTITNFVTPAFIIPEANAYRVSVWVYRNESGTSKQNEGIKVWASTEPDINSSSVELFHAHRYIGFAPVQTTTGWYKYEATIPISGNNVYVIFQGICEYGNATYMDDITVERIPTCETPSISVSNAVATITPGTIGTPESYDLQIGEEVVTGVQSPADLMLLFPSLQNNTEYEVAVRANCGDEDYSQWSNPVAFITPCAAISLPYTENFDGYTSSTTVSASTMPDCWNRFFTGTSTSYGAGIYPSSTYAHSGNNSLRLYAYYPTTMTATQGDAYAVLPAFSGRLNNMIISFYTRKYSTSTSYVSDFEVGVVTDINNIEGSFVPVQTVSPTSTSYQLVTVRFENYEGADGRIAFRTVNPRATSYRYVYGYVDDLTVETIPTCGTPSLSVTGTMATITPSTIAGTPESYDLQIGNEIQNVTTTSVDLWETFNLEPSTEYEVSVRSNCGENDGVSAWSQTVSFRTPCSAVELPIYEDFESAEFPSSCWSKYKVSGSGSYTWASTTTYKHSGSKAAFIQDQSATTINHLVTPQFNLTNAGALLTFWVKRENDYYSNKLQEGVQVLIADNAEGNNASEVIYIHRHINNQPVESAAGWYKYTAAIQKPAGQYYLIFRGYNEYGGATYMDDIAIEAAPSCGTPTIAVDGTRLTITPNSLGNPESYEVLVSGQTQTVTSTTVDLMETFGLELNTDYEVKVRTNCGENDGYSEWTAAIGFTTPACLNAISVAIGTESTTSGNIPFTPNYEYSYSQQIFDAAEINAPEGGQISEISIYCSQVPSSLSTFGNITVWMSNTTKSTYASVSECIPSSALTQVYHLGGQFNLVQGWNKITLDEPFQYDGTSNLAIAMYEGLSGYSSGTFNTTSASGTKTVYIYSDYATEVDPVDPASSTGYGYTSTSRSNIKFNICPPEVVEKDMRLMAIDYGRISCEADPITITVKNTGAIENITTFVANYSVNEGQTITETVTLPEPLVPGATTTYTLSTVPTYDFGSNTLTVWIELQGVELQYNTVTDYPYLVAPKTVPYVINNVADEDLLGWNAYDLNNDGITMIFNYNTRSFGYTFNDVVNANDVMISPCMNLTAGSYNVEFDYNALSALNEQFKLGLGAGTEFITELGIYSMTDEDTHHASTTVTITEDGTYNFGFLATSLAGNMGFVISNFAVYPIVNVTVEQPVNGAIAPTGVVAVNYGEDLTLAITPNEMYHVSGVFVDGVQVVNEDPYNSNFMLYTLENVTAVHTVSVEFKLEFHIIKSVENYNAAYTDVPGYFIPAATDTLVDPNPVTVNFRPSQHYHFVALELGIMSLDEPTDVTESVVANLDGSYSYTIDTLVVANYYLNAIFERNKVNINYNVLTGKGYANDSEVLTAPESYTTVVDHSINGDIDTTVTFAPYTTGDVHSDYHIVDVTVDGESQGVINDYTFTDITANHNVDIKYGYQVNATVRNYAAYNLGSTEIRGTIAPAQQLVAEGEATIVTGTIQENFHLYNLFVDGVDMMNDVIVIANPEGGYSYTYTIDSTIANYNIEAVVKLDTVGIHYHIDGGQGYADFSGLLNEGDDYTTHINFGDSIMSVVMPAPGYSIANYILEGFDMGAINGYQFNNVRREYYVHLNFVADDIAIVTNAYGHGTVSNGMNFTYNPETPVNYNFVATPEEGYHITNVLINGEAQVIPLSGSFQYSIDTVDENYTFDVYFDANTYTMTATATGAGMINPVGVQTVAYGTNMTYVATAFVGSYISSVTVDTLVNNYTQDDNLVTFNIPFNNIQANHNVTVSFAGKTFGIVAEVDENGHGRINSSTRVVAVVNYGMGYVLDFTPDEGYHVSQILVDGEAVEVADSYQFVDVQANHNVVVSFAINEYTLTATSNVEACTITPAETTANYGTTVNYTINVATGYHLVNVMDNGTEVTVSNNAFAIESINANHVINANFEANTFVVTVNQPAHAVITPGTQTVTYGATPEYVIVPQAGYEVVSVTAGNAIVPVTTVNGVGHFTLSPVHANLEINAVVAQATYTISVLPSQGQGTVSPATNQTVTYGSNKTFTFAPATHYVIGDIIVDGVSKGALTSYTFVNVVANHTIQAVFEGACAVPTDLNTTNITSASAQLSWSNTGAESYTVRYQAVGETTYHETTANTNSCTISGLAQDAIYYWSVKANCDAANESDYSYEMQFITEPANVCDAPTNLTVEEVYNENVKVSWTSNATTFNVRCKRQGDDPSTYVYTYGVNGTEYTFNYLLQATTYNWGVQTICNYATGNLSAWAESTFTTGSTGIATDELSSIKVYSHLNNVYVVNENGIAIKDVKIYDIYGKLVYSGNATSNPEVIALNVANGNYVVKLDTENGVAVYKLAIIR